MDIDLKKLSYFVEVVNCKNFTMAAERLYVSQPMLSKVVRHIEEEVGATLIERSRRSFQLTEEGELFYQKARNLLEQHKQLMRFLEEDREVAGSVSISIPASIMNLYFPRLLVDIVGRYPGIKLNVFEEGSNAAMDNILSGKADLAVVMLPVAMADVKLTTLVQDRCVLVGHESNPLMQKSEVHVKQLEKENFIVFNNQFVLHDMLLHACKSSGFVPNITYQSSQDTFIIEMVELGQGIAVLPRPVIQARPHPDILVTELEPKIPWNVALAEPKNAYTRRAVRVVAQAICEYFQNLSSAE